MKITFRIWILIIVVILSLISIFSIPPMILKDGVVVTSVKQNSTIFDNGLREGMTILSINGQIIESMEDYKTSLKLFANLEENETQKLTIQTEELEIINLFTKKIIDDISAEEIPISRIKTGLDLRGGARVLISAENHSFTYQETIDVIASLEQRLNIYGLKDIEFYTSASPSRGELIRVEIASLSPDDLEKLIIEQGKFEAKIGNDTVFIGGDKDITYVETFGQGTGIYDRKKNQDGSWTTFFRFGITLSPNASDRYALITKDIPLSGENPGYLDKKIDFYIDDKLRDSLLISEGLRGSNVPQHSIQGSGTGITAEDSDNDAKANMKQLQTILKTGSLPFKLEIVKIDKISPNLGEEFTKQIMMAGVFAILAVSLVVFVRYRKFKVSLALITVSLSEVLIILGVATLVGWNLDLPSIAGIIAAIGMGIDSQLIILDESRTKFESLARRIKNALFIIVTAFTTTFVAMIPLTGFLGFMGIGAASAGLLKGFAVTTLLGITTGVLISRPAFADIAKQLEE